MDYPSDPAVGLVNGKFTDGDPANAIPASLDPAAHLNAITDELLNIIVKSGLAANESDKTQVFTALNRVVPRNNLIINPSFTINQRVYVSAAVLAANTYAHDRWKAGATGGDYSFTQLDTSTQITIAAGKSLIHVVDTPNVVGGTYTLSWTGTAQARFGINTKTPAGAYAVSPITTSGQLAATMMAVEFTAGTLSEAKLETGSNVTTYVARLLEEEFSLCLRYFESMKLAAGVISVGQIDSTGTIQVVLSFNSVKRLSPTITLPPIGFGVGALGFLNSGGAAGGLGVGTVTASSLGTCLSIRAWGWTGLGISTTAFLYFNGIAVIKLDAEIY